MGRDDGHQQHRSVFDQFLRRIWRTYVLEFIQRDMCRRPLRRWALRCRENTSIICTWSCSVLRFHSTPSTTDSTPITCACSGVGLATVFSMLLLVAARARLAACFAESSLLGRQTPIDSIDVGVFSSSDLEFGGLSPKNNQTSRPGRKKKSVEPRLEFEK